MNSERKYYCFCEDNCKFETMTKEQILAAIAQAVETGSIGNCDTGFITKVKETNSGNYITIWVGTHAQFNAIETKATNCLYIFTDDTTTADILAAYEAAVQNAEQAANAATQSAAVVKSLKQPEDLTAAMTFSLAADTGEIGAHIRVDNYCVRHNPVLNILTYNIGVFINGSMTKGQTVFLKQENAPEKDNDIAIVPLHVFNEKGMYDVDFCYASRGVLENGENVYSTGIMIRANEDFTTEAEEEHGFILHGWHYVVPTE